MSHTHISYTAFGHTESKRSGLNKNKIANIFRFYKMHRSTGAYLDNFRKKILAPIGIELTLNDSEECHSPYIAVC